MPIAYPIEARDLFKGITVTISIRGLRRVRFRLWLMRVLLRLVAWVAPVRVDVEEEG